MVLGGLRASGFFGSLAASEHFGGRSPEAVAEARVIEVKPLNPSTPQPRNP